MLRGQIIDPMFLPLVEALRWVMGEKQWQPAPSPLVGEGREGGDGEAVPDHAAELAHSDQIRKDRPCLPRRMHRHPVPGREAVLQAAAYNPPRARITSLDAGRQRARIHSRSVRRKAMQPAVGRRGPRHRWTKMALPAPGTTGPVLWSVTAQMS